MAKKSTTKSESSKKKTTKKEHIGFAPFIMSTQCEMMMKFIPTIKDICKRNEGIEQMSLDDWKKIDQMVIEISREAMKQGSHGTNYRTEPIKRATYTITQKVREMERKKYILHYIQELEEPDEDRIAYICNQIFLHMAIMLTENSKS